uniref:U3 small nucleolar RNA-associated protein 13 C-terminal domain-containing protein n=1 Tax=Percolomonas cosmopolitus TaxID=63605 RepID=A0A7S1KQ85_9EUKA
MSAPSKQSSSVSLFRSYGQKTLKSPSYDASLPLNIVSTEKSLLALSSFTQTADIKQDSTVQREHSKLVLTDLVSGEILSDRFIELLSGMTFSDWNKVEMLCYRVIEDFNAVLVSFASGDLILYKLELNPSSGKHKKLRVWKVDGYCVSMDCHADATHIVALGFSNGSIRLLNLKSGQIFKDLLHGHTGRIHYLKFATKSKLWSCGMEGLKIWNGKTGECTNYLLRSTVTDVRMIGKDRFVATCGNRNLTVHDFPSGELLQSIPLFDTVLQVLVIPRETFSEDIQKNLHSEYGIVTFSEEGYIRVYDISSRRKQEDAIFTAPLDPLKPPFVSVHYSAHHNMIVAGTENADILFYSPQSLERVKQFVGFNEAVMDVKINKHDESNELLIASNSDRILIVDRNTQNTDFLIGHSDSVVSLATGMAGDTPVLISSSRDRTVRVWDLKERKALGLCDTHTDAVTAVAMDSKMNQFFVSVGEDTVMKVYNMKQVRQHAKKWKGKIVAEEDLLLLSNESRKVHEKDVNDIDISANGKLIATASFDKKVKIWNAEDISLEDTFVHKKGVWTVRFSPTEKVIATGSADHMIRIWSLSTHACLKVFEGHAHHVMRVAFLNRGTQLMSGASSGMIKLWNIKTAECLQSYDVHSDRVWGMCIVDNGKEIITGSEDRNVIQWTENTKQVAKENKRTQDELVLQDQKLRNLVKRKDFEEAITLALSMDQPRKVYGLFEELLSFQESKVVDIVRHLDHGQVTRLLEYSIDWNTNSRFAHVAHHVLHAMFRVLDPKFVSWSYEKSVDSLIAYSQRHYKRLENLIETSFLLDYTIHQMKILLPEEEVKALEEAQNTFIEVDEKIEVLDPEDTVTAAVMEHVERREKRRHRERERDAHSDHRDNRMQVRPRELTSRNHQPFQPPYEHNRVQREHTRTDKVERRQDPESSTKKRLSRRQQLLEDEKRKRVGGIQHEAEREPQRQEYRGRNNGNPHNDQSHGGGRKRKREGGHDYHSNGDRYSKKQRDH